MMCETYIGRVKSDRFDYDTDLDPNDNVSSYTPDRICVCKETRKGPYCECTESGRSLYWDIVGAVKDKLPNTKQTDWGCFVWRMSKKELVERLNMEKYNQGEFFNARNLLAIAKDLPDTEDYLLVAVEIY